MAEHEIVYLRCGDLPANGLSKNYRTNEFEKGISVYEGIIRNDKALLLLPSATENACAGMSGSISRPVYLVKGDVVGQGSDGEPVLVNVEIIRQVELFGAKKTPSKDHYAKPKPIIRHQLATNYTIAGSNEYIITCTCGAKLCGPDYYDVQALFDFHLKRNALKDKLG